MDDKKVHVVVIDTGISEEVFYYKNLDCKRYSVVKSDDGFIMQKGCRDYIGHGSAVMQVFYENAKECKYTVISAYDFATVVSEEVLLYVLSYILEKIPCDIINISGGLTMCLEKQLMQQLCNSLAERGTIIVSAFDNLGAISYPACLDNVIGIDGDVMFKRKEDFYYYENSAVDLKGFIRERLLVNHKNEEIMQGGSSFLAPYISSIIAGYMKHGITNMKDVREKLKAESIKSIVCQNSRKDEDDLFSISSAVLFPFNKEIDAMCRNADLLDFEIKGIYDSKYLGKIGEKIDYELLGKECVVKDISQLDWNENFDCFILGHIKVLQELVGYNIKEEIVKKCIEYRKNLYVFDGDLLTEEEIAFFHKNHLKVFFQKIQKKDVINNYMGKLYMSVIPSIGVFGTSPKQGKYTVQLGLRRAFIHRGYKVAQIGTEPTALLFGMDSMIPMGYNCQNELNELELIIYWNNELRLIEEKRPDIVVFGSQSQTIPYDYSNISCFPCYQQSILFAMRPDISILCVNVQDEIEYIKRTIAYIECVSESRVFALIISPIPNRMEWTVVGNKRVSISEKEIANAKKKFEEIGLPILDANQCGMDMLTELCVKYLSD